MTNPVRSPADLANLALTRMGYKLRLGSLYDGSKAAVNILTIYAQTRDAMLRSFDWDFAERNISLTLQKTAPAGGYVPPITWSSIYPALPWMFQYGYPSDCLKVRAVKQTPIFVPNFLPQPNVFNVATDVSLPEPERVILCNVPNAVMIYTGQITDPEDWDVGFAEAFAASLARHLGPQLMGMNAAQQEAQDEQVATLAAEMVQG